jgi:chromosome partitioning protein
MMIIMCMCITSFTGIIREKQRRNAISSNNARTLDFETFIDYHHVYEHVYTHNKDGGDRVRQTIAFVNQKGGVGKTTVAMGVTAAIGARGYRTLMVDVDPQCNLTYASGADGGLYGALELIAGVCGARESVQRTAQGDVIASSPALAADGIFPREGAEFRLRDALEPLRDDYDLIALDCPPSLGILSVNALVACTGVVLAAQADAFSLQALGQVGATLSAVRARANPGLRAYGIVVTRYNARTVLGRETARMLVETAELMGTKVYRRPMRESVLVREAQASRVGVASYAPKSGVVADLEAIADEILEDMGEKKTNVG